MPREGFFEEMLNLAYLTAEYSKSFPKILQKQRWKVEKLYDLIEKCNAVHVYGKGRSGAIAVCLSLRLSHFDFKPVYFLGDVIKKVIDPNDLVILLSGSGDTSEIVDVAIKARNIGAKVASLTSFEDSMLARNSDLVIVLPGGMEKGKGWKYLEAQLNERPSFYGGGEFELYAYLFQEILLSTIGKHRGIAGSIIAKTHERDETIKS